MQIAKVWNDVTNPGAHTSTPDEVGRASVP